MAGQWVPLSQLESSNSNMPTAGNSAPNSNGKWIPLSQLEQQTSPQNFNIRQQLLGTPSTGGPTNTDVLKDTLAGPAEALQNILKGPALSGYPAAAAFPGMSQQVNNILMNKVPGLQTAANYPIAQKMGIPDTSANRQIQNASGLASSLPLGMIGPEAAASEGGDALTSAISQLNKNTESTLGIEPQGEMAQSAKGSGKIFKGKPSSNAIATAMASKDMPSFYQSELGRAKRAYSGAQDYLTGSKSKVDLSPYTFNEQPNNAMDFGNISEPEASATKNYMAQDIDRLRSLYPEDIFGLGEQTEPHFLDSNTRDQLSNQSTDLYNNVLKNPTGKGLQDLRSQLGSEAAGADTTTASGRNYQKANLDAQNTVDNILRNHLSQDKTGNALKSFEGGNHIYNTSIYPMRSNKFLRNAIKGNVRFATPNRILNATQDAEENGGMPTDHPFIKNSDALRKVLAKENKPTGKLAKTAKVLGMGALGGLPAGEVIKKIINS